MGNLSVMIYRYSLFRVFVRCDPAQVRKTILAETSPCFIYFRWFNDAYLDTSHEILGHVTRTK